MAKDGMQIEFRGWREALNMLENTSDQVFIKALPKAVRSGAAEIRKNAKKKFAAGRHKYSRKPSLTKKAIGSSVKTYRRSGIIFAAVGVRNDFVEDRGTYTRGRRRGQARRHRPSNIVHLIENGFYNKRLKRFIPGRPFLAPALVGHESQVLNAMARKLQVDIPKIASKLGSSK